MPTLEKPTRRLGTTAGGIAAVLALSALAAPGAEAKPTAYAPAASAQVAKMIPNVWQRQETSYWCGPATARIVLSARTKSLPTQRSMSAMAGGGGTNRHEMAQALNARLPGSPYEVYNGSASGLDGNGTARFWRTVVHNINARYSVALGILVQRGTFRPPGYPNRYIDHWVAVTGYTSSYNNRGNPAIQVTDPVAGRSEGFQKVPARYWLYLHDVRKITKTYVA